VMILFNERLDKVFEFLRSSGPRNSLGDLARQCGHVVFPDVKGRLVSAVVEHTWEPRRMDQVSIVLDNARAFQSIEAGVRDPLRSQCIFCQAFERLGPQRLAGSRFRERMDERERLFEVRFRGEEGLDWGGLYREAMGRAVEDVFSPNLELMVLSPNGRRNSGGNQDRFLPNPRMASPRVIPMFHFLGRLMGLSMRQRVFFAVMLPPLVWKMLVGEEVTLRDVADVDDAAAARILEMDAINASADEDSWTRRFGAERFVIAGIDGQPVELVPNGASTPVTFRDRHQFVALATHLKLHEVDRQVDAMRAGLLDVVPERAVRLCTWSELELHVCGDPHIDVAVLRENTVYVGGYSNSHSTVQRFWRVLDSLSDEERSKLVRFSWGRSRLPKGRWPRPFKLTRRGGGNNQLPIGHTCFFQLELPEYSTDAIMRQRILTAITYGLDGSFLVA
jgi:HECT-domain (ubiquitin-transferase)